MQIFVGFSGFCCKHCQEHSGRFFPTTLGQLSQKHTVMKITEHLCKCTQCPLEIRKQIQTTRKQRNPSRGDFMRRIWYRIHPELAPQENNVNDSKFKRTVPKQNVSIPIYKSKNSIEDKMKDNSSATDINTNTKVDELTTNIKKLCYPSFYSKYVMDELLYKYPEGAMQYDSNQQYPLMIAIQSNKQWIGGGIQSLYDIYPNAVIQQMSILQQQYPELYHVISTIEEKNNQQQIENEEIIRKNE